MQRYIVGSGGGGCFPKGTLIACPQEELPIELLRVGMSVLAFNVQTGQVSARRIREVITHTWEEVHAISPLILIYHEAGCLELTANHWVYAPTRTSRYEGVPHLFIEARELSIGDVLTLHDGTDSIIQYIKPGPSYDCVYNLEVDTDHTYIADGVIVHNGGGGGKSGGGGGRTPVEAADSLRSQSFARVLDLISEGEIEGLVNGLQSVYLDGTPIQNADGSSNFTGVSIATVNGTQSQSPLPGFPDTESEHAVNIEVKYATPIIRTITDSTIDAVRVRVAIPGLSKQNSTTGDISGASVQIAIDVQANGGGYVAQNISHEWQGSPIPAVTVAVGILIEATWTPSGTVDINGDVVYASITYTVQYRVVGAGAWTTYQSDSLTTGETVRSYSITGLASALYEAQVVKTSGDGSITLSAFNILQGVPYDTITGKTTSTYQRSYRIPLTGSAPWDIRMRRITADSTSVALRNKTTFDSYTEITDESFSYPNSAIVGLSIDSSQFSQIPSRGYDVKLLRVRIPSNYNPVTRVYTGIWDGTFTVAWTDNPAWCFYDLATNTRYGMGSYLAASNIDKWALYTIAQYCDGMVPNGLGAQEPRFTCNLYLQTQAEAFQVMVSMASIFRGMAYWAAGAVTAVQDSPSDAVFLFTEANVEGGLFTYAGSAKNARHTVALVTWNDPADGYKSKPEYVEDTTGIARYGVVQTSVAAVGCTSRGQAHRVGNWILYSERLETEAVTFRCGLDGTYLRPGNVFAVQDQHRAGIRYSGRILSATSTSITIDQAITISSGQTYTIQVVLPDGTLSTKTVTNAPGSTSVLTISVAFAVTPTYPSVWMLTSTSLSPHLYRALSITEVARNLYEVSGLEHNASKYDLVEQGLKLVTPKTSTISTVPTTPQNLTISEALSIRQGDVKVIVTLTWEPVATANRYRVEYRRDSGNYFPLPEVRTTSAEIVDALPGFYEVRVVALNILSATSSAATASRQIYGKTARPADVTGFIVSRTTDTLNFSWIAVADLDLDHYELRQGLSWEAGVLLGSTINTQFSVVTNIGSTYLIKAIDTTGNESLNAAAIIISANTDINVVVTANDATGWAGAKFHTQADTSGVTLTGQNTWANLTQPWNTYTSSWIKTSNPYSTGTYVTVPIDLGVVMTSRVEILPIVQQLSISGVWTDLVNPWATYTDPWSGVPGLVSVTYEMALSQDGATYAAYQTFLAGHYLARAYKFRITLSTSNNNYLPLLTSFLVTIDVPDRVIHYEDKATVAGGTTLTFSPAFVNVQTVTGTIQAGSIGDTFRVTSKTNSSAVVTVYDSAGTPKSGIVDIDVFGYGSI